MIDFSIKKCGYLSIRKMITKVSRNMNAMWRFFLRFSGLRNNYFLEISNAYNCLQFGLPVQVRLVTIVILVRVLEGLLNPRVLYKRCQHGPQHFCFCCTLLRCFYRWCIFIFHPGNKVLRHQSSTREHLPEYKGNSG